MMSMDASYDVVILGSGFSGTLMAMALTRMGRTVLLVEKGSHPRFAIGESSTPMANLLLGEFARRFDLPGVLPLTSWGAWQRELPQVGCGLKRGFTFYHHTPGRRFADDAARSRQLLVGASPHDGIADTHWYRPDFDLHLLDMARGMGVAYRDRTWLREMLPPSAAGAGTVRLRLETAGVMDWVSCRHVMDATGPRGAIFHQLGLEDRGFGDDGLPSTEALFSHYRGVGLVQDQPEYGQPERPPYPPDAAAVHHLLPGGWIWVLRFSNGITSAGAALSPGLAATIRASEGEPAWERLLEMLPSVKDQFRDARPIVPFVHQPRMPFRSSAGSGPGWVLLPSAMGFVDPIFSTGFPLTLLGMHRIADAFARHWGTEELEPALRDATRTSDLELGRVASWVAALYRVMDRFPRFCGLARLYFAAVIFSETHRRLGRGESSRPGFLLSGDGAFAAAWDRCIALADTGSDAEFFRAVRLAVEPVDLAGLLREDRRNWLPVDAADLFRSAHKVGASHAEIEAMLHGCGFFDSIS